MSLSLMMPQKYCGFSTKLESPGSSMPSSEEGGLVPKFMKRSETAKSSSFPRTDEPVNTNTGSGKEEKRKRFRPRDGVFPIDLYMPSPCVTFWLVDSFSRTASPDRFCRNVLNVNTCGRSYRYGGVFCVETLYVMFMEGVSSLSALYESEVKL